MKEIILPEIVAAGIFNARNHVKNKEITKNRKTTMFEIELPIGKGGVSYIDKEAHTIVEDVMICAKPGQIRHTRLPFNCYYIHIIVKEGELFDMLSQIPSYVKVDNRNVFEKIYTGEKSIEDIEWVKKVIESKLSSQFVGNVTVIAEQIVKSGNTKDIGKLISSLLSTKSTTKV